LCLKVPPKLIIPVERTHLQGIAELNRLCGFPERSAEGWGWALFDNPEQGEEPAGYVYVRNGEVCAFLGTQRRVLRRRGGSVTMLAGHTMITNLKAPGIGLKMMKHVIRHHGTDAISTLNNNALAAPLYPRVGMSAWLGGNAKYIAECQIDWFALGLSSVLRRALKNQSREAFDRSREYFCRRNRKLCVPDTLNGLIRIDPENPVHAEQINDFNTAMQSGDQFQSDRSAEVWRYRLRDPDFKASGQLYGSFGQGRLEAMLALSVSKDNKYSPATLEVEDIAILPGADKKFSELLKASESFARTAGLARVRLHYTRGVTEPHLFRQKGWVLRHKAYDCCHAVSKVEDFLESWAVGPMGGDFFFALRRIPA
jgi:hypothetical protein